ncbi:hypothetical protein GCM10027022_00980 [Alpinimonas psychrophila]|uniref:VIT family protein n=1 Tax=Alpinimonas psychrophila TaxID=748908 RepID=A0A7W3PQ00_9MICO|nr:hypothetical protein [Alpinimonas psychrophila]MBA8829965.1 hypothetical protein [Alpinimonas psychrophila]
MTKKPAPIIKGRFFQLNPDAVLSLVVFGVAVAVTAENPDTPAVDALIIVVSSIVALFVAHVFAHSVAGHGFKNGRLVGFREAISIAIQNAVSMFMWVLPATVPLVLGAIGIITTAEADRYALLLMFGGLFAFGFLVFYVRHSKWYVCVLGSLATGLMGTLVVAIELIARLLH